MTILPYSMVRVLSFLFPKQSPHHIFLMSVRALEPVSKVTREAHPIRAAERRKTLATGARACCPTPLLKEEGWTRHQERCREATFDGADGVVPHEETFRNADHLDVSRCRAHASRPSAAPRSASAEARSLNYKVGFAAFFLMPQPPLLYQETSELLRQPFFKLLEARRPMGTGGFSSCCNRQTHHMAFDLSSSET